MTICIGVLCESRSCAILVADRMITSGLFIEFEHPVSNKLTKISPNCLALTAGDALAFTELFNAVLMQTSNLRYTPVEQMIEIVKEHYQKLRHDRIVDQVLKPRSFDEFADFYDRQHRLHDVLVFNINSEIEKFDYGLEILIGGVDGDRARLYTVSDPGTSRCFDSIGFHAIGSGFNLAMSTLIGQQCHQEMELSDALLTALYAKITAENAPGVGSKTDISLIMPGPLVAEFGDREIIELKNLADRQDIEETGNRTSDLVEHALQRANPKKSVQTVSDTNKDVTIPNGSEKDDNGARESARNDDAPGSQTEIQDRTRQGGAIGENVPVQD